MNLQAIIESFKAPHYDLPNGSIIQGDSMKLIKLIPGNIVDCYNLDPPWFNSSMGEGADAITENWALPDPRQMLFQVKRTLKKSGIVIYYGYQPYLSEHHKVFQQFGFKFMFETIWGKSARPAMGDGRYPLKAHANVFVYRVDGTKLVDTHFDIKRVAKNPEGDEEHRLEGKFAGSHLKGNVQPVASRLKWDGQRELIYRTNIGYPLSLRDVGVVKESSSEYIGHACQIPVTLDQELIEMACAPGDLVVDMFFGSGTTGVACERSGRKYLGFEITEEWAKKGHDRILRDIQENSLEFKAQNPTLGDFESGEPERQEKPIYVREDDLIGYEQE